MVVRHMAGRDDQGCSGMFRDAAPSWSLHINASERDVSQEFSPSQSDDLIAKGALAQCRRGSVRRTAESCFWPDVDGVVAGELGWPLPHLNDA